MNDDHRADKASLVEKALKDHQGSLLRYAARIAGDAERGADAVQETFMRLWKEEPPPAPSHLSQWLFTVCRNAALDGRRKEGRMSPLTEAAQARASSAPGPHERLEEQESAGEAMQALAALPPNQQEVVRLKFQNGFTYRQIAGITGLSESNVGFLIHTAIKNIRRRLGADKRPARA